ncbi:MAG: hypothetical protein ACE5IY_20905 [bacterium]
MNRKYAIPSLFAFFGLAILCLGLLIPFGCNDAKSEDRQLKQISFNLERLAAELSIYAADPETRAFLTAQIQTSPKKSVVVLQYFLAKALEKEGGEVAEKRIFEMMGRLERTEEMMRKYGARIPKVNLDIPVRTHRDLLKSAKEVYVAVAPLVDESDVKSIVGYSNGKRLTLSPDEPPQILTLVVKPAETDPMDPEYPLDFSQEPGDEEDPTRIVDEMVGILRILITDDNESWWLGDPEIQVEIERVLTAHPSHPAIITRIDLRGVDDENVWYGLGDPNATYRFVNSASFSRFVKFHFWEDDDWPAPSPWSDDDMGSITVDWTTLPFVGVGSFSTSDVQFRIDKD